MKPKISNLKKYLQEVYPKLSNLRGNFEGNLVKKDDFEEKFILQNLEKIFLKYRGYTFALPNPGEYVIMYCSGGLDSTILWAYLMDIFKLKVIPFHFQAKIKSENESFNFFSNYYKKLYPKFYQEPYFPKYKYDFLLNTPHLTKLSQDLSMLAPNFFKTKDNLLLNFIHPVTRMGVYAVKAFEHALFLQYEKNIKVRTIFTGLIPEDTLVARESTLTISRSLNLFLCLLMGDFSWQFTSLALEPKYLLTKKDLILFAQKKNIPAEHTWSCQNNHRYHCGNCVICGQRKRIFELAKIPDKTLYEKPKPTGSIQINLGIKKIARKSANFMRSIIKKINMQNFSGTSRITLKKGVLLKRVNNVTQVTWLENDTLQSAKLNITAEYLIKQLKGRELNLAEITKLFQKKYPSATSAEVLSFIQEGLGGYLEIASKIK